MFIDDSDQQLEVGVECRWRDVLEFGRTDKQQLHGFLRSDERIYGSYRLRVQADSILLQRLGNLGDSLHLTLAFEQNIIAFATHVNSVSPGLFFRVAGTVGVAHDLL